MSSRPGHIIRNMHLEVEFQHQADAFELRSTLAHVCKTELVPALEKLFDEKTHNGKIVKADTIVFDIGTIDKEHWNKTLVDQIIRRLTEYFAQATPLEKSGLHRVREEATQQGSSTVTEISEEENIIQSILHFLNTGLLPWHTVIKSRGEFVQHVSLLINQPGKHFHKQILATIRADSHTLVRLVDQVPEEILESILRLSGITSENLTVLLNFWIKIFEQTGVLPVQSKQTIYRAALSVISEISPKKPFTESISERVVALLTQDEQRQKLDTLFNRSGRLSFISLRKEEKKILRFIQQRVIEEDKSRTLKNVPSSFDPPSFSSTLNVKDLSKTQNRNKPITDTEGDGLFITNAGLVILHPFLVRLFENVGYAQEKKWVSENHQQRAVMLTQYLVTGKQEYPEFDLLLNKLLTGYPLENSLPADIRLSDFEIQEAEDVLKSVLNHWKVLKNTSIAGLQSTFFQREGKLLYSDARWLLQVEQKTVDILLNKLPWGIGIIKLPWMESRLHVEWA